MSVTVLRALGLGDLLTAVPALRALRRAFPDAALTIAAPRPLAPLAALLGWRLVDAAPLAPLPAGVGGADLLVNLHGRGPQSHRVALAARPRRLVAFTHPGVRESRGMPAWRADEHEVARWCRLLDESGLPADATRIGIPAPPLPVRLESARGATVVHPGAASAARRWPAARFAHVAASERAAGRPVVVTGTAAEEPLARDVAAGAGLVPDCVLAGRTSVLELAALVAVAGRVVCGDTGVAHLATALDTPAVLLFGPTSPRHWGPPPGRTGRQRVLWAGRRGNPHATEPDSGLLRIATRDVLAELASLP